jgi:phenylalanyl-tRNA synthetase beta chain
VLFELALPAVQTLPMPQALPIGRNPRVWRDVALWVAGGVQAADVLQAARQANGSGLLQDVVLFDIYRPPAGHAEHGQTSMALRMVLGSPTATLTDEQADAAVAEVQQALVQHCQARLRV